MKMKTKTKNKNKAGDRLPSVHPGEVLLEEFLKPMGITQYRLAQATGIPHSRITDIIHERRGISADTALRFSRCFGTTPDFWVTLQQSYDLREAQRGNEKSYAAIPLLSTAAA